MSADGLILDSGRSLRNLMLSGATPGGVLWFAVGTGDWPHVDNPPPELPADTSLASEVARKRVSRVSFLERDDAGVILFRGQRYREMSPQPDSGSPVVGFFADFTETELVGTGVCEEALFGGGVVTLAAPFALASEVVAPGVMFWRRNRPQWLKGPRDTMSLVAVVG